MKLVDMAYIGLPYKAGGRSIHGVDCVGLAHLWLTEQAGLKCKLLAAPNGKRVEEVLRGRFKEGEWARGDLVLFSKRDEICHVAIHLGGGKLLHTVNGYESRVDNGPKLLRRVGFKVVGAIDGQQEDLIVAALNDRKVQGDPVSLTLFIVSIALAALSAVLAPSLSGFKNKHGRYGQNALVTQRNPEIPLPDLLGQVVVAGNAVYQQLPDRVDATANPQKWNQIIVLSSGPVHEFDAVTGLRFKGVDYSDAYFYDGASLDGIYLSPEQTKDEAVTGTIGGLSNVPSMTLYDGAHDISVPVDIRAHYDRGFPIYGLSGVSYLVLRAMNSDKFGNLNLTLRIKGRKLRTFNSSGFVTATASSESLTGADGSKVRFKLAQSDIVSVSSLTVNGNAFAEISAAAQTGDKYQLNRTKGFVEFITAPAAAATITITYVYYVRAWSQNPAMQIVYLLTEVLRGRGFDASRLEWASFVDARDYYDETVSWTNGNGVTSGVRYASNYAVDDRKPITEHLRSILDACNSMLFLSDGRFVLRPRTAESSVFSFTTANILVGPDGESSFEWSLEDRSSKPNRVKLFYHSDENLNAESDTPTDDEDNQRARVNRVGNGGVVDKDLKLPAVTSLAQAERLGEMFVREQTGGNRLFKWTANIRGLALQPGDVVDLTHPTISGTINVRIEELEQDEQDRLVITAREYVASALDL